MDGKKRIPTAAYRRYTGWGRKEEGVYKVGSKMGLQQYLNQEGRRMESGIHYAHRSI